MLHLNYNIWSEWLNCRLFNAELESEQITTFDGLVSSTHCTAISIDSSSPVYTDIINPLPYLHLKFRYSKSYPYFVYWVFRCVCINLNIAEESVYVLLYSLFIFLCLCSNNVKSTLASGRIQGGIIGTGTVGTTFNYECSYNSS